MITIFSNKFNNILNLQANYNLFIHSYPISSFPCPVCHNHDCLIHHAYYNRFIKYGASKYRLTLLRVLCKHCLSTHALIPHSIIPYYQIDTNTMVTIIDRPTHSFLHEHPLIEDSNILYIRKKYNSHFRSFIKNLSSLSISTIVKICFTKLGKMFMLTKNIPNSLFIPPT